MLTVWQKPQLQKTMPKELLTDKVKFLQNLAQAADSVSHRIDRGSIVPRCGSTWEDNAPCTTMGWILDTMGFAPNPDLGSVAGAFQDIGLDDLVSPVLEIHLANNATVCDPYERKKRLVFFTRVLSSEAERLSKMP